MPINSAQEINAFQFIAIHFGLTTNQINTAHFALDGQNRFCALCLFYFSLYFLCVFSHLFQHLLKDPSQWRNDGKKLGGARKKRQFVLSVIIIIIFM